MSRHRKSKDIIDGQCQYTLQTRILVKCNRAATSEYKGKKYCSLHYEVVRGYL